LAQRCLRNTKDYDVPQKCKFPNIGFFGGWGAKSWFQVFYANAQQTTLNWDILKREFAKLLTEENPLKTKTETDFDFITTKGTDIPLEKIQQYTKRLGVGLDSTPDGEVFINGKPVQMSGVGYIPSEHIHSAQHHAVAIFTASSSRNWIADSVPPRTGMPCMVLSVHILTSVFQLYLDALSNDIADMSVYFYDLPTSGRRRNKLVYPSGKLSDTQLTSLPQLFEATGFKAKAGSYLQWREAFPEPG